MAYLHWQGREREREPESARPDGPQRYRYPQKQGHPYHHHPVPPPPADDVHSAPTFGLPGGSSTKEGGGRSGGGSRWSSNEHRGGGRGRSERETPGDLLENEVVPDL